MAKTTKDLLEFWEDQMKLSHMSSNYFFRKSPSHYHMMLLVMHAYKYEENLTVVDLAGGTGDIGFRFLRKFPKNNFVNIVDINHEMLIEGNKISINNNLSKKCNFICSQ